MTQALEATGVALRADALIALRQAALRSEADPVLAALPGGFATKRKGAGQEVADVREYQAGDDIRHLDRGSTARTGKLHVRQFQEERDRVTLLVADFRAPMFWGISRAFLSVAAAETLSLIGWRLIEEGARVGLLALTPEEPVIVPPRGRARGMLSVIGGLVQAHEIGLQAVMQGAGQPQRLDQALGQVERICPPGAEIIVASGFEAEGAGLRDRLDALDRRRQCRLVLVADADCATLPEGRYPIRLPDGRRAQVVLGRVTRGAQASDAMIAARAPLRINSGDTPDQIARQVATAFVDRGQR